MPNAPYPIFNTVFRFASIAGLIDTVILSFWLWINNKLYSDLEKVTLISWKIFFQMLFFILSFSFLFSCISGIILALVKLKIDKPSKYFSVFLLGFCLTLPISYVLIVGFGANKTLNEVLMIVLTFGLTAGLANITAGKITLPKT